MKKKYAVQKSGIRGKGLFAVSKLGQHEIIFIPKGIIKTVKRYSISDAKTEQHMLAIAPHTWLKTGKSDPLRYLNHSCEPNAYICGFKIIVATKDIMPGEEITIDYSFTEEDPFWELDHPCQCGTPMCRVRIRSITHLPQELRTAQKQYTPDWLQKYT
ncbi:MAG: SET domain-containing protein-lysine N-methyltransferase [Parcubacteria group bacterium]|nr:SET domain-containing protein-lysine N-methyltransferase [Parcubacteria group bacterium]